MLIDEASAVVDLVVDDQVEILLGVVFSDLLESEFLGFRHGEGVCEELTELSVG